MNWSLVQDLYKFLYTVLCSLSTNYFVHLYYNVPVVHYNRARINWLIAANLVFNTLDFEKE